jgi:hypothetical protein
VNETPVFASIRGPRGLRGGALDFVNPHGSLYPIPLEKLRFSTVARNLNKWRGARLAQRFAQIASPFASQSYPLTVMPIWLPDGKAWPNFDGRAVTDNDVLEIENWNFQGQTAAFQRHIFNFCLENDFDYVRDAARVLVWLTHGGNHRLFARLHPVTVEGVPAARNLQEVVFTNVAHLRPVSELIVTATRALNSCVCRVPAFSLSSRVDVSCFFQQKKTHRGERR